MNVPQVCQFGVRDMIRNIIVSVIMLFGFINHGMAETHWLQRPDDMVVFWLHDGDQYNDRVRILYSTTPSLQQGQEDPEGWRTNVYVVEAHADGTVDQRRIFSRNEHLAALLLRRGHDQVFALLHAERGRPTDGTLVHQRRLCQFVQTGATPA